MPQPNRKTLLQREFAKAESELKQYEFSKNKSELTAKEAREKRRLQNLLRKLGTELGSMSPSDKLFP